MTLKVYKNNSENDDVMDNQVKEEHYALKYLSNVNSKDNKTLSICNYAIYIYFLKGW